MILQILDHDRENFSEKNNFASSLKTIASRTSYPSRDFVTP